MRIAACISVVAWLGVVPLLTAQSVPPYNGSSDYQAFCSSCHGSAGKGDGVIASSLKRRPADLTQIAQKNSGVFPADKVFKAIDAGGSHGSDMPEWSGVFVKSLESSTPAQTKLRIESLVKYLESIQAKR